MAAGDVRHVLLHSVRARCQALLELTKKRRRQRVIVTAIRRLRIIGQGAASSCSISTTEHGWSFVPYSSPDSMIIAA
ncbi:MAG TPA: hypothetical protein VFL55_16540 [Acetobacteraceae bacterium]|nr:hypothetical protein [Acetobacteraceae bacterium]